MTRSNARLLRISAAALMLCSLLLVSCTNLPTQPTDPSTPVENPKAEPKPAPARTVQQIPIQGQSNSDVKIIQQALVDQGAGISPEGNFGPLTAQAIKDFQKAMGLEQTGKLDEQTLKLLNVSVKTPNPNEPLYYKLAWNSDSKPERVEWSKHTLYLAGYLYEKFNKAQDFPRFCPKYKSLKKDDQIAAIAQLIVGTSYYESSWNPTSRMTETTMGTDPITGKQVSSEGLLQLSYQDIQWAPFCEFDWSKDKNLAPNDPKKTILDPFKNLSCGMKIMANQINSKGKIVLTSGVYWAVLKEDGKYEKIDEIAAYVKKLPFCN